MVSYGPYKLLSRLSGLHIDEHSPKAERQRAFELLGKDEPAHRDAIQRAVNSNYKIARQDRTLEPDKIARLNRWTNRAALHIFNLYHGCGDNRRGLWNILLNKAYACVGDDDGRDGDESGGEMSDRREDTRESSDTTDTTRTASPASQATKGVVPEAPLLWSSSRGAATGGLEREVGTVLDVLWKAEDATYRGSVERVAGKVLVYYAEDGTRQWHDFGKDCCTPTVVEPTAHMLVILAIAHPAHCTF